MASPPPAQPVKTHQTGTRNPFGPIPAAAPPPVPKPPTLMELAMGYGGQNGNAAGQQQQAAPQLPQPTGFGSFSFGMSALNPGSSDMSSIASSFSSKKPETSPTTGQSAFSSSGPLNYQNTSTTTTGSTFSDSLFSSSLSTQPTGATNTSSSPSISFTGAAPLKSQSTGFSGLKPFKPSSSFGASLLESLPPIPGSAPTTPAVTGAPSSTTSPNGLTNGNFGGGLNGGLGSQPTGLGQMSAFGGSNGMGSTLGQGLRPQMTGGGANPFRASMFSATPNGTSVPPMPTGLGGRGGAGGRGMGGNMFGSSFQTGNPQNQQQHGASLI